MLNDEGRLVQSKSKETRTFRHEAVRVGACLFACLQLLGGLCGVTVSMSAHAQAQQPAQVPKQVSDEAAKALDNEEQLRRTQQQTAERNRKANAPNVDLQGPSKAEATDDGRVPAETPCFKVNEVAIVLPKGLAKTVEKAGERALSPDPLFPGKLSFASAYLQRYRGQCIGREGLNLIVHRLSALILKKGYTTTRVLVAPQDLSSGRLMLELVPGTIGRIHFADAGTYGTWRNAFPTHDGDLLDLRNLEQGLEQMKRVPNQDVDMQIVPGESTGESDVVITTKRLKPWTFSMSVDDSGLKSTGQLQASANLAINDPLGLSDIFNISYNHDVDGHPGQYGTRGDSVFYAIPWGNWTFTATASQYHYHQEIAGAFSNFVSSGLSRTFDLKAEYMVYRNQVQKNSLEFRAGKYFSQSFVDGSELVVQHRDNSYAELGWEHKHYFGPAQLDSTLAYRWGTHWFGAESDLVSTAPGVPPTFYYHMETLDATLSIPFELAGIPLRYSMTMRAQNSPDVLYPTEYFSIGGRYTVRGFDGNTMLSAEKGAFVRNDLEIPVFHTGQTFYFGLDGGEVFGPEAQNLLGRRLAGAVIGLRGSPFKNVFYDVFIGGPLYQPANFPNHWPVAGFSLSFQI